MRREMPDPLVAFKGLDDFDLYSGDGHFGGAASHLHTLDLRSHGMTHLTVSNQVAGKNPVNQWLIALRYKSRRDVEKALSEFKNKPGAKPRRGSSASSNPIASAAAD
jgi:hypothetical protein